MGRSGSFRVWRGFAAPAFVAGAVVLFLGFFYFFGGWSLSAPADLTLCNGDEPQTLDPAIVTGQLEGRICVSLFEGLTTRNAKGDVIPGMAESWERSPDGLMYTFHLRPGIKWSNGDPVTASDFLNSWERVLNPVTGSEYAYQLYYLVNGEAYGTGKLKDFSQVGVKAPDEGTLVVNLAHPTAYFLELTTLQTLCPVHLATVKKYGNDWTKPGRIVSNGPYVLKEWRLNDYILLEANPYYWRRVPIHRIKVLPTSSPTACFNLFYSGKTDLILDTRSIPSTLVQDLRKEPYFHSNPYGATSFVCLNVKRKPFDDVRVRKALALALDKEDIVTKITRAGEAVADTLVPPGSAGYTPPKGLGYNVAEARRLLAEAGYPNGQGFPDVKLLFPVRGTGPQVATEMQALWRRDLGITSIHLEGQEWKVYLNTQDLMDFDLCLSGWIGDYNDPQTFIDMFVTGGGNNHTGWGDAEYDQMLATSENTADPAQRMKILSNMEKILVVDQAPIIPVCFWVGMSLYYPGKLGGLEPNFVDDHRWGEFYIPGKK
ncbi:MAG TPA: peptide ABC transporter substrate-binding protein [Candidatus Methylacidiphilales bacterium]|jgi:oligopeptide transport system substrate-binding protein|nr:peptide ABC transporter substrate-binding protein [Candidatus Methylacidiphilales bacterium]